jgi:hypothetical protein
MVVFFYEYISLYLFALFYLYIFETGTDGHRVYLSSKLKALVSDSSGRDERGMIRLVAAQVCIFMYVCMYVCEYV